MKIEHTHAMTNVFVGEVAPILGAVLAELLFFGPMTAVLAARKHGVLGALNPLLFPFMFGNCIGWTSYGFELRDTKIVLANLGGIYFALFYIMSCHRLTESSKVAGLLETLGVGLGAFWGLVHLVLLHVDSEDVRTNLIGYPAVVMALLLFASPLTTLREVVREEDSSSINRGFMCMQLINCALWVVYGLFLKDLFVYGPNALGFLLGIVQLVLVLRFPASAAAARDCEPGVAVPPRDSVVPDVSATASVSLKRAGLDEDEHKNVASSTSLRVLDIA